MTPPIFRNLAALKVAVSGWKAAGESVGVVPTMGALHPGHLSLVREAKAQCDRVIVTIFVNPKQFNNPEDLENYPRTEEQDAQKLIPFEIDGVFVPDADEMYPAGFATNISITGITDGLCGAHRPGHFDGVATVVTKLLLQTAADKGFFGEKDYQQLMLVQRLVTDLDIPTLIVGCPTIREEDGLALSSRNLLLSDRARIKAPALNDAMSVAADAIIDGTPAAEALATAQAAILAAGFIDVEYLELRSASTLAPLTSLSEPARLLAAANLAGVRLIDNIAVTPNS